jgi:hypothetical protein
MWNVTTLKTIKVLSLAISDSGQSLLRRKPLPNRNKQRDKSNSDKRWKTILVDLRSPNHDVNDDRNSRLRISMKGRFCYGLNSFSMAARRPDSPGPPTDSQVPFLSWTNGTKRRAHGDGGGQHPPFLEKDKEVGS